MEKVEKIAYFDFIAPKRDIWRKKNRYYYQELEKLLKFIIPPNSSILEIGCGTGDFIKYLRPKRGVGIDFSPEMIRIAKEKYPEYEFLIDDAENLHITEKFDYVILSDLVGYLDDVWQACRELQKVTKKETRIIITYWNYLWEPLLNLGSKLGLKMPQKGYQNWLTLEDIENLLNLNGYEVISKGYRLLFPKYIPIISFIFNRFLAKLPFLKNLCLIEYIIAKEMTTKPDTKEYSCSIIIPTKNEVGNIEGIVKRTPMMGTLTELIFVDGNSTDGTCEKIKEMMEAYPDKNIKLIHQGDGIGKADAVRKGFDATSCDILFILDGDLTVCPEDLPKFYISMSEGRGEFINGTRLVYPLEKDSMRFLNKLANKAFGILFSWLLEQRLTDTLCGTKVLFKKDYQKIVDSRSFFGNFDPFGDFDLLFGAAKLNLKIVEIPVRYKPRTYGDIKIKRFKHGLLLLKMSLIAFKKLKLD
ncbi:TPA: glycosyl transferase [bacterium]|nr:glycosyl transferase [bacterium]